MGIEWHTSRFLIACSKTGTSFTRTLTLGHQHFHLSAAEVHALFAEFGGAPGGLDEALSASAPYADGIMRLLGAQDLVTVDASAYEGASVVYDMNAPLEQGGPAGRALRGGFDVVFYEGTFEHNFNFPTAVKNAMEMVKVG